MPANHGLEHLSRDAVWGNNLRKPLLRAYLGCFFTTFDAKSQKNRENMQILWPQALAEREKTSYNPSLERIHKSLFF